MRIFFNTMRILHLWDCKLTLQVHFIRVSFLSFMQNTWIYDPILYIFKDENKQRKSCVERIKFSCLPRKGNWKTLSYL